MCLNLGYTSHEIGWYLNFRQSNVYGWIFVSSFLDYSRKDARDASANEASHAHLTWKNISSTNMSIYCACRYIHIYIIYMYIMLYHIQHIGIPNFRLLGYCFEKSSCNGKKKRGLEPTMAPATSGSLSAGRHRSSQHFSETRKSKKEFATVVLKSINH